MRALYILIVLLNLACDPELLGDVDLTGPNEPVPAAQMSGFSWVVPGQLAAMPRPTEHHSEFLRDVGVSYVISLTIERPEWLAADAFDGLHLPVEDFQPPTLAQQITFVEAVGNQIDAGGSVAVHCTAGLGRSGTLVATWFVAQGLPPQGAIELIRQLRPGSIETAAQEAQVHVYAEFIQES